MANDAPAIVRDFEEKDGRMDVLKTTTDTVTFNRGLGDSGYRVQLVEHDCPECSFDRMIRRWDVNVEFPDEVRYYCLNPNCPYFVRDRLSYACHGSYPQNTRSKPVVFE